MSIKIHHGPNGSYKTSGAIQDDAVPALKEGRLIITNVRGFTLERVLQVMPELPSSVDIINLDLESLDDMERMRTWFQWAPRGAFIIFDETQLVFPKAWRERDLERFDFPGGPEAAAKADRPMNWLDGWTRHRHWNWDIVLTTPNIAYKRQYKTARGFSGKAIDIVMGGLISLLAREGVDAKKGFKAIRQLPIWPTMKDHYAAREMTNQDVLKMISERLEERKVRFGMAV